MTSEACKAILKATYPFLETEDLAALMSICEYKHYRNREKIIKSGTNNKTMFFILKGMVRGYFFNKKGAEKNIFLRPERTISGAADSLFSDVPTKYTFEAILETELLVFNFVAFKTLSRQNQNIGELHLAALQENLQILLHRVESLIDQSPEERYEELLDRSPQFFQKAFNKHIANYLGITPVSLSRIIRRKSNPRKP